MPELVTVAAMYKFASLPHFRALRSPLAELCRAEGILGSILLAAEGLNGTVAGPARSIDALIERLRREPALADLEVKRSYAPTSPFYRMKVRLKAEIVSMGEPDIDPTQQVGTYVEPSAWNALLDDPEVLVLDTRNHYEVRIGTFERAVDPGLATFRDFPSWAREHLDPARHRKVAMFCTGGIRCEKASALLLREGFEEVYHLRGGILRYLETTPPERSKWRGECFVFDQRVALDHRLAPGAHELCYGCQEPVSREDMQSPHFEWGVACPRCHLGVDEALRARRRERVRQIELARARGDQHLGSGLTEDAD